MKNTRPPVTGEQNTELHTKENITIEVKEALKDYLKGIDTELLGRPLYVLVIGDNGMEVFNTRGNVFEETDTVDILVSCLQDLINGYNEDSPNL